MIDSTRGVYRIADLSADERPRERLAKLGPQVISSAELLATLLRVGVAGENAVQVGAASAARCKGFIRSASRPFR